MENFIKILREKLNWTMRDLGDHCVPKTGSSTINKLEKGNTQLTQDWMNRIADALECSPLDLLDGGPDRLSQREKAVVGVFRGLSEERQDAFYKAIDSMAEPIKSADNVEEVPSNAMHAKSTKNNVG